MNEGHPHSCKAHSLVGKGTSRGMFKVLGAQSREHLFLKWDDLRRPPRIHDIFELNLETPSTMLAHQGALYMYFK